MLEPCRYYFGPGGCKRGSSCHYSHSAPGPNARWRSSSHNSESAPAPSGACRFYWSKGWCKNNANCPYKHIKNEPILQSSVTSDLDDSLRPTNKGRAVAGTGAGSLSHQPMNILRPRQVNGYLKRFLQDDFEFSATSDVYIFFTLTDSAISANSSWSFEDKQLFLASLTTENGLRRMSEVLRWAPVSVRSESDSSVLSFQRAWLPFLRFLSSDTVVKSTLRQYVDTLYSIIINDFGLFSDTLIRSIDEMIAIEDKLDSQIVASISEVLLQCLSRFENAVSTQPQILVIARKLKSWVQEAMTAPQPDNAFHLSDRVQTIMNIVDREQARSERAQISRKEGFAASQAYFDRPGALCSTGPRHDNDEAEIQNIRIAPTHEELICKTEPFLPGNSYDAPHHLPQESIERLLDIQFRLLREELIDPLRSSINLIQKDMHSKSTNTKLATILAKQGGKYHSPNGGVGFNVYTGVKFHSLTPDNRGLSVDISFDTPPGQARQFNAHARAVFWEHMGGKRMMQGGLVGLIWSRESGRDIEVCLGTIASSSKELAESARRRRDRVSSRIIFFDSEVEMRILNVLKNPHRAQADEVLLVEAPMMYEAIRPFLEALTVQPETIPFKEYLVHRPPRYFDSHDVNPPRYATLPSFKYHLECLLRPGDRTTGVELAMDVTDPISVENARNALKRGSRLDPSQVDAVVAALTREVALIQGPPGTGKSYTGIELLRVLIGHVRPILMIAFTNHALDHLLTGVLDAGITSKIVRLGSRSADERISEFRIENLESQAGKRRLVGRFYRQFKLDQEKLASHLEDFIEADISTSNIITYIEEQYPEHYEHICHPPPWISTLISSWNESERVGWQTTGKRGPTGFTTYGRWLRGEDLEFLRIRPDLPLAKPPAEKTYNVASETSNMFNTLSIDTTDDASSCNSDSGSDGEESGGEPETESEADWQRLDFASAEKVLETGSEKSDSSEDELFVTPMNSPILEDESRFSNSPQKTDSEVSQLSELRDPLAFFTEHSMSSVPEIPVTDQPLDILLAQGSMWSLSLKERWRLDQYWRERTREAVLQSQLKEFENLRGNYKKCQELFNQVSDGVRRDLLSDIDIIGCTTTGAAKYSCLLRGIEPRVVLVEEAGQVLEAHILANLVPSIEHLIMIGDPLQLRPTLNNYKLSVDNPGGGQLYKFDMSLMERLSSSGFPMSVIDVQRRMRPEIAQLIRSSLYPRLEDHNLVKQYPDVRGFARNVFFLSHQHRENDGNEENSGSKYNTYEVQMIKDMVLYLLRQGCYSQDGDIVVLCAYLGQLALVRDALSQHVAVVLDERDQEELADREVKNETLEPKVERVQVSKRVRLRTVDNYQGEEGKIVILSLVRNAGNGDDDARFSGSTIGFLKSKNRTNVALSRAKHGLYMLGNAALLAAKSQMWNTVLEELRRNDNVGDAFPVACHRHPDKISYVSRPGQLPQSAPDGGCLQPCEYRMKCEHVCPFKCHPDDPHHVAVACQEPCKTLCIRGHQCPKLCYAECGQCMYPIPHVALPCGHVANSVPCYMMEDLGGVKCNVTVTKQLASCEHTAELPCSMNISKHSCTRPCGGNIGCCGRTCDSPCFDCQAKNPAGGTSRIERKLHREHLCKKPLYCGHDCLLPCLQGHECPPICREACRQRCAHRNCPASCSTPCELCKEVCTWACPHYVCPVPCGSACTRLPCDKKCEKRLRCGHRCPSICGEDCGIQVCPTCASPGLKKTLVDLILKLDLDDILTDEESLDNLLITLPGCHHVFTVETLDDICHLEEYYTKNEHGEWRGLASPQHARRRKSPMCPTCRAAITSLRYGRVFKSANSDLLERNIISHMSDRMNKVQKSWSQIKRAEMKHAIVAQAKLVRLSPVTANGKTKKARNRNRNAVLSQKGLRPVPANTITPHTDFFGVSPQVAQTWNEIVKDMTMIYKDAADVWVVSDQGQAPMTVGIAQPRADKWFFIEAIWVTLQIKLTLAELARAWITAVEDTAYPLPERQEWGTYGIYLLKSCEMDVRIAYEMAEASNSRRQMTQSRILTLRISLEKCRFNIEMSKKCGLWDREQRLKFAEEVKTGGETFKRVIAETTKEHSCALLNNYDWFEENFSELISTIRDEWGNLKRTLREDTFYEPLSLDDKMTIVKALGFSDDSGHVYICQDGHPIVVTECRGTIEASRCTECGQRIRCL